MSEGHSSIKVYMLVFLWLGIFTVATVAASYLRLEPFWAVTVAVIIASIKAAIVATYFMHLKFEGRIIFGFLALTAFFWIALVTLPLLDLTNHPHEEPGSIPAVEAVHSAHEAEGKHAGEAAH